ncbi:hypothetical protein [Halobaculum marinum]|uniref:Small CPxCG-related zinc finger protein n=1 Tax=Halobaculum marinum TaxID=3031996 RepID=A0ABD5WZX2_9EURY|nr:hypothetical protein [Halobaculum sp. DT55]
MSHVPEAVKQYVCADCQTMHAGTPIHHEGGSHTFEPPTSCGACEGETFVELAAWIHHHE